MPSHSAGEVREERHDVPVNYRELFDTIREGFFIGELVRDAHGRASDFVLLEVNRAFTELTGVGAGVAVGRPVSEAIPGFPPSVVERYGRVVDSGKPAAFEVQVPALADRWYEARAHPLEGDRFVVLFLEITEHKKLQRALEESQTILRDIVESVDQMIWSTRPDGYHDFFNRRWYEFTGVAEGSTDGERWAEMFHPDDRERTFTRWRHSLATGEPYEIEYRLRHRSGEYRWVLGRAHPVRNQQGEIIRWMGTCTDIHAQKMAAEQSELIGREQAHRIKNLFAVISGLVALSARSHPEARGFADELVDRLSALSRAQGYATPRGEARAAGDGGSTVLGLVRELLKPYDVEGRERMIVDGEDATVSESAVTPISLAVHELATNAAKYGALSVPEGQVHVHGERKGDRFLLCWTERGGPPVSKPEQSGFGSRLVDVTLSGQLRAELTRDWRPEGLEVCLSAPVERLAAES